MKGVILAGGYGTRLLPMTRVTNKHLLPVYDRPMVYFPIESLCAAGITEVLLVTGGNSAGAFVELLGNGTDFGLSELAYAYQDGARGIADALSLAEDFADGEPLAVILGDNIFEFSIEQVAADYVQQLRRHDGRGARIALKNVRCPQRFGVPRFEQSASPDETPGRIIEIIEKPKHPPSPYAVVGLYMYDDSVFDIIRGLTPSARDELEITDVNNAYLQRGQLEYSLLDGWWSDAGTIESLHHAAQLVAEHGANNRPLIRRLRAAPVND
jgi:glucose-1-phosphate thymidylyltransferase